MRRSEAASRRLRLPGPGRKGPFSAGQPSSFSFVGPEQITRLAGLAADEVATIDLSLASGRVVPAALQDNAVLVRAPTTQLPAKLVAYDDSGRVIGIQTLSRAAWPAPAGDFAAAVHNPRYESRPGGDQQPREAGESLRRYFRSRR